MNFTQSISDYTKEGRQRIYKNLEQTITYNLMKMVRETNGQNTEYVDNKMSGIIQCIRNLPHNGSPTLSPH